MSIVGFAAFALISPDRIKNGFLGGIDQVLGFFNLPELPEVALGNFCGEIHSHQYQHAHNYYSRQLQQAVPLQTFIDLWSANGNQFYVISCELGTPKTHDNRSEITVLFSEFFEGWRVTSRVSMIREDNEWKINDLEPFPSVPPDTVVA